MRDNVTPMQPGGHAPVKNEAWSWYEAELDDLSQLAKDLRAHFPQSASFLRNWNRQCAALARSQPSSTLWGEAALDDLATGLRKICLRVANFYSVRVYRSPPDHQMPRTAEERPLDFGYERDIHPTALEARGGTAISGWQRQQVLFSSGQSALQAILLAARRLAPRGEACSLMHLGSYFETDDLIRLLAGAGLFDISPPPQGAAKIVIYEPVHCTPEGLAQVDADRAMLSRAGNPLREAKVVICDTTLCRERFDLQDILDAVKGHIPAALVVLFRSGLKLDQAGLELANVGIVTVLDNGDPDSGAARGFAKELRHIRTLTGSGLRFEDINALSAPWFLGPDSHLYADRVFANNARLAEAFRERGDLILSHPGRADPGKVAPFCLLQLPQADGEAHRQMETRIENEARRRGILLQRGGSFGFRGHRYQAIVPAEGRPFIRLALGARHDASAARIIEMINDFPWPG